MKLNFPDRIIDVFTISPRTTDPDKYWTNIKKTIELSDKYLFSGNLIFTGNDIYVDTWIVADAIFNHSKHMSPLIAVNPIYMHPFSAAKMISSFAYIHQRKTFLNCVTGTSNNDLDSLNDNLNHSERYERLGEYMGIVKLLLKGTPVTFNGSYYKIKNLQLQPPIPEHLFPEFYVAGASEIANKISTEIGAVHIRMAQPLSTEVPEFPQALTNGGVYFGVITRETETLAWERANKVFPECSEGLSMLEYSMLNTNSQWKKELKNMAEHKIRDNCFYMQPFKQFQADCPYYVGSHSQIADVLVSYLLTGKKSFIIDIPCEEEEYLNLSQAFTLAYNRVMEKYDKYQNTNHLNIEFKF